jgi:hypothetical protein
MATLILAPKRLESAEGDRRLATLLRSSTPVPPILGLGAYAGGYPVRLREALADTYEAVVAIVGDAEFSALVNRYVRARPPTSYNLNDAGDSLWQFLRGDPVTMRSPFLPDLAELEWKIARAFHAHPAPVFDAVALGSLTPDQWPRVVLGLQPGVSTVRSRWPIRTLWEAPHDAGVAAALATPRSGENVLVYRHGLVVRLDTIDTHELMALRALARGRPLAVVLKTALGRGAAERDVAAWAGRWQSLGLLAGWRLRPAHGSVPPGGRLPSEPRAP